MSREIKFELIVDGKIIGYETFDENIGGGAWCYVLYGQDACRFEVYFPPMGSKIIRRQFTGLKDKNGKEIYEGDILKIIEANDEDAVFDHGFNLPVGELIMIEWDEFHAGFVIRDRNNYRDTLEARKHPGSDCDPTHLSLVSFNQEIHIGGYAEVIGNIYENPELIQKSDQ